MTATTGGPQTVPLRLRSFATELVLPPETQVLRTSEPQPLAAVDAAVREALAAPIGCPSLGEVCRRKIRGSQSVVVVISDNTRPAPYRGESGILWPLVDFLLSAGLPASSIILLVATGTHRVLAEEEIWAMVDERIRAAGVRVHCHDAADPASLTRMGRTRGGIEVFMDSAYVEAGLRILTGVVEPHFMAGASGGRKSICPGLLDVRSVREFHGPDVLAHENVADLVLGGNPCHELSLEIARMAEPDFILNATIRQDGRVVGVFAGDMEEAHSVAVGQVRGFAQLDLESLYDVVVVHGGYVGVNHYQAAKAACAGARAVRQDGYLIVAADTTEPDPIGTAPYRRMLQLLARVGPEGFDRAIRSEGWEFVHDQWEVQMWAKLLRRVPREHLFYFSPQTPRVDYALLPCADPAPLLGGTRTDAPGEAVSRFVAAAVARAAAESRAATGREPSVAYLADGPHSVPVTSDSAGADGLPLSGT